MTFKNKIISLSSAVAVLTLIYVLGAVFSPEKLQDKKSKEKLFDIAQMENVSSFTVSITDGLAEIEKIDGKWMIKSENTMYPASEYKIENFLDSLYNLTKFQIVSDDEKYWEKFDLTEEKAKSVKLKNSSSEELFTLYLGKSGPGERGEYIRSSMSDEAYLTDGSIKRYFYKDLNYWSQLRVLPEDVDSASITAMNIKADVNVNGEMFSGHLNLIKEDADGNYEWYYPENNEKFQRSKADTIANNISSLVADKYIEDKITEKDVVIQIETEKHGKQIIDIQKKSDNDFLLNVRGEKYTFQINQYKIHRIISRID